MFFMFTLTTQFYCKVTPCRRMKTDRGFFKKQGISSPIGDEYGTPAQSRVADLFARQCLQCKEEPAHNDLQPSTRRSPIVWEVQCSLARSAASPVFTCARYSVEQVLNSNDDGLLYDFNSVQCPVIETAHLTNDVLKCRAGQSTDILPYNRAPALNCLVSFGCSTVLTDSSRIICRYRRPFPQI